jgi:hypothetical protein
MPTAISTTIGFFQVRIISLSLYLWSSFLHIIYFALHDVYRRAIIRDLHANANQAKGGKNVASLRPTFSILSGHINSTA